MARKEHSAHDLVEPAVAALIARTRAAADRLIHQRHDAEAVHDFRVGLRRMRTVVRAARQMYGRTRSDAILAELTRFGDATNALRDEEVLDETIHLTRLDPPHAQAVRAWLDERARHEVMLRDAAVRQVAGPELDIALAKLRAHVARGPKRDESIRAFAKRRLKEARRDLRALLPVERSDVDGLHRLRIRFKRLRYTCEMLGQLMPGADAAASLRASGTNHAAIARHAARMQKLLGLLHDVDVALDTVGADEAMAEASREHLAAALTVLRRRHVDRGMAALLSLPDALLGKIVTARVSQPGTA
jgi:CHAD domain-containing protein